jgi:hypothetical protein
MSPAIPPSRALGLGTVALILCAGSCVQPASAAQRKAAHATTNDTMALSAGYGHVTPAYRHAIDRVVADSRTAARTTARSIVDEVVHCVRFDGQRYCLGTGWTDQTQAEVRARATALLQRPPARRTSGFSTGDLSAYAALRRAAAMSPSQRVRTERAELTQAARSVAKVWLIRHEIQGVPLPHGFFADHPEVRRSGPGAGSTTRKHWKDYPRRAKVLNPHHVTPQHRTYWCGPTTMQMIAWGWHHKKRSQRHWARRLGTTSDGTTITSMVQVVNAATGYDKRSYAGPYITLDIGDWSFDQWKLLIARHVVDYRAPVILHPVLLTQFYPYLDHDGSGHFQVGRGYRKRPGKNPLLGYFEPWNQQRFHPDEPFIDRVQWRDAYRSYRANEAHFQHNIGV